MAKQSKKNTSPLTPLNPFRVTIDGMALIFKKSQPVAILLLIIAFIGAVAGRIIPTPSFANDPTGKSTEEFLQSVVNTSPVVILGWFAALVIISIFILVLSTMLHGIASYTAAYVGKGQKVTLSEAFNAVLENFGSYFIVYFLINIKVFLWALLFIIPGIIAYYRYSFAGILFFDKDKKLRGDAALQESSRLAKNGLLTIFASHYLLNLITLFFADRLISLSSQAILYREYTALDRNKSNKPKAHSLSWFTLFLPVILVLILIGFTILLAILAAYSGRVN